MNLAEDFQWYNDLLLKSNKLSCLRLIIADIKINWMKKSVLLLLLFLQFGDSLQAQTFNPITASRLQSTIDSLRSSFNVKGISASVLYPGMGVWKGVSGISHAGVPITSDMVFAIASNTKLFTGVLLLKLAENNLIQLDDSLHEYLPTFKNIDSNITIRQLLNHTSGLFDVTSVIGYPDSILSNPNRIYTATELMTWAGPPLFAPGKGWSYCNTNYLLAGMIAESATGQSYGKLLRDSILIPLQLDSTFLDVYDSILFPVAHPWQAGVNNVAVPRKALNSAAWAAGAMYSTSTEMVQWYDALMNGRVIKPEYLLEMTRFVGSGNYGLGISQAIVNGKTVWQHGGTIWGGYNSFMMYDTASGAVICVLTNQLPAQANQIAAQLHAVVMNITLGSNENGTIGDNISLYPNPTKNSIYVNIKTPEHYSYVLFNHLGQQISTGVLNQTEDIIHLESVSKGVYFIQINGNSLNRTFKFIKQ